MPVSDQQVEYFLGDVLKAVPDVNSPDVTLHVFQAIEKNPDLRRRYDVLHKHEPRLNAMIGSTVKRLLNRENAEEGIRVDQSECTLIDTYTRFKP